MLPLAFLDMESGALETVLRLLLAVVLGGVIGLEREFHGRPAGLRTHILVCLGATLAMLSAGYLPRIAPEMTALRIDPGRIAAGILTGIGFIGAGAILRLKNTNRGLTTASCIWFVAALGVCIGVGSYGVAVGGTLLALFVLLLSYVEQWIRPDRYRDVVVVAARSDELCGQVRAVLEEMGLEVQSSDYDDDVAKGEFRVTYNVKLRREDVGEELVNRLRDLPGVRSIGWRSPGT